MRKRRRKRSRRIIGIRRISKRTEPKKMVVCFRAAAPAKTRTNQTVTRATRTKKLAVTKASLKKRASPKKTLDLPARSIQKSKRRP